MVNKEFVFVFHGWEDDSTKGFIPKLVKDLKEKGYEPKAFDQPNTNAPKFEEWFKFAEEKIGKIDENKLNIVGHSMGGLLALKLAEKHKIKKLVLVAPVGSKPSEEYYKVVIKDINAEEMKIFKEYNNRNLDVEKIKQNVGEISFIFGEKDPWITEEIRNFYGEKFKDVAKITILQNQGHMSEGEGVKKLPELENLFEEKEIKEQKAEKPAEEKAKPKEEKKEEVKKAGRTNRRGGRGRYPQREEEVSESWEPKTKLGKEVKDGKV